MTSSGVRLLYVSDLTYQARGRRYCDEDIHLSARLRPHFDLALCHPVDAERLMSGFDVVIVRNSGPVLHYRAAHESFRKRARAQGVRVFSELTGRADMAGKQYLVDLFAAGYPVIPTVDDPAHRDRLPSTDEYVAKPKWGADSIGLEFLDGQGISGLAADTTLIQPRIDFRYEVSFYFVDRSFQYALYAPDPARRWKLEPYDPTGADLVFAQRFVDWNTVDHGISRVDACRTRTGELLLVELEDLNPYLSLDLISEEQRNTFVTAVASSITALARQPRSAPADTSL